MRCLRQTFVAFVATLGALTVCAKESEDVPVVFSGRMLVAVKPAQARQIERSASSRAGVDDWQFSRIAPLPTARGAKPPTREWVVATPPASSRGKPSPGNAWDLAHKMIDGQGDGAYRGMLGALSRAAGSETKPDVVEPDLFYKEYRWPPKLLANYGKKRYKPKTEGRNLTVGDDYSVHWPEGKKFAWHLTDDYSQLSSARDHVMQRAKLDDSAKRVKVGIVDTGYCDNHVLNPEHLNKEASRDFSKDPLNPTVGAVDPFKKGPLNLPGHGCRVMSVVSGNRGTVPGVDFEDYIGGAPFAEVIACRISDSVVHFFPSSMAMAIKYATANECDVLNISHGGLPSGLLADAVNEAYENGTAIIAAAGDFFSTPLFGLSSPQQTVYPAAFNRVISVTGATAARTTYGRAPSRFSLLKFKDWSDWMLRGSYGPNAFMHEAIAAYAPNVAWALSVPEDHPNLLTLDGKGTSAATPQVTAAAALWLQHHRDDPYLASHWRSWQKVEALYWALFDSAQKRTPEGTSTFKYFGNGLLKANDALAIPVMRDPVKRPTARVGYHWLSILGGFLPGIRSGQSGPHDSMIRTEISQLVHGSIEAQALIESAGLYDNPEDVPAWAIKRLAKILKKEQHCSDYLQNTLREVEKTL
jgi:hypothetical protein